MKKIVLGEITIILLMTMVLSGCSYRIKRLHTWKEDNNTKVTEETQGTQEDLVESQTDSSIIFPQFENGMVTEEMYQRATKWAKDESRLAAVMKKALSGEEITIGFIGGSITQGSSATKPENSYASLVINWWEEAFPKAKITSVNAGIGGTTSYLGVHRVDKELLEKEPDLVIVEFSVNDSNTLFYKKSYDSLVRKILKSDKNPAVLLLFNTMEDGTSAQEQHVILGFNYGLPMISYRDAILPELEAKSIIWSDISPDNIHPNDKGHGIIGELMWKYFNSVLENLDQIDVEVEAFIKDPVTKDVYANATILDNKSIKPVSLGSFTEGSNESHYSDGWTTDKGEEPLIFEVKASNIGVMFYRTIDGLSGSYDIYVDGEYKQTLNGDFTGGWGNSIETIEVYHSKENSSHTIEIKRSENSEGGVSILGLLIS